MPEIIIIILDVQLQIYALLYKIDFIENVAIAKQSVNFDTRWSKDAKNDNHLSNVMNLVFDFLNETISIQGLVYIASI